MDTERIQLITTLLSRETLNTLYMVISATFIATIIGLPLGILLTIGAPDGIKPMPKFAKILGTIVNIGRSFPFAILMIALIPLTRLVIGTSLGTTAAIIPLSVAAAPFVARVTESALQEVDKGIIEAATAMGSSTLEIIYKVLLPESKHSLVLGLTLTMVNLVGYSAMAGLLGGGGLGKVAIQYGYQRWDTSLMIMTIIVIALLVQLIQGLGSTLSKRLNKKIR